MTDPTTTPGPPAARSTFVTVLAWLGIILSGVALASALGQSLIFRSFFQDPSFWQITSDSLWAQPSPEATKTSVAALRYFLYGFTGLMALGLAASIGLLHRQNWARLIVIGFLVLNIAFTVVSVLGVFLTANMPFPTSPGVQGLPDMSEVFRMMRIVMSVMAVGVGLISGWLIVRLMSKPIRAEFADRVA